MKKKLLSALLVFTMVLSMTACGAKDASTSDETSGDKVTIKVFSNLPDRPS